MYKNVYKLNDINDVKKLDKAHMVKWAYLKYKRLLRKVITEAIYSYQFIPQEKEDFLNLFMFELPDLIKKFDVSKGVKFEKFICKECKYYVKNKCRLLITEKHRILNNYIDFKFADWLNNKNVQSKICNEIIIPFVPQNLKPKEQKVVEDLMEWGIPFKEYAQKIGLSRFKGETLLKTLQLKLAKQLES